MDPIVTQLEHVNIEFSATSHKDEISALKKLEKPSPQIVLVVEALCILFGIRPQKSKGDSVTSVDYFEAARKHIFSNSANLLSEYLILIAIVLLKTSSAFYCSFMRRNSLIRRQ